MISFFTRMPADDGSMYLQPATGEFWTPSEFKEWLREPGHKLWACATGSPKRMIRTLEQALSVMNGPGEAHLMLEAAGDMLQSSVYDLERFVKNHASGIEHQTTKAMVRDPDLIEEFGTLELVNDGRAVTFVEASTNSKCLEVDGMVINTAVLLVNEAKATPKVGDAANTAARLVTLRDILRRPSHFTSQPPCVLETIQGVDRVVGVLSGFHFAPEVREACTDNGLRALLTNGEGYSVEGEH